jgi:hypothetical protein
VVELHCNCLLPGSHASCPKIGVKLRWKILLVLLIAGIIGVMAAAHSHNSSRRRVEAYKKQLLARGEKLSMVDLAPTPSTNKANGALVFMAATNLFRGPTNYPSMMRTAVPGFAWNGWRQNHLPTNAAANYWTALREELQPRKAELRQLQDLLHAPEFRFDLDYSLGPSIPLMHLARLKGTQNFAAAWTMTTLHDGDYAEAWENLRLTVSLVRTYQGEPLIISHLVRTAMASIAISASWEALQYEHWTDQQLSQLQADWEAIDLFAHAESTFKMERAEMIDSLRVVRKASNSQSMFANPASTNNPADPGVSQIVGDLIRSPGQSFRQLYDQYPRFWAWKWSWSYDEEFFDLECMDAALELVHQVKTTGAYVPASRVFDVAVANIGKSFPDATNHFLGFAEPEITRNSVIKYANIEVARRLLVTAIALRRHQLAHGKYPDNLDQLAPNFLPAVPVDLMDGKPLRYQLKTNDTYLLYSVGEDGIDNGGDPTNTNKYWLKARDAVWPMPMSTATNSN